MVASSSELCVFFNASVAVALTSLLYRNIMHSHIQRSADAAEQRINFLLEEEQEPFTMNDHYLMDYRSKFLGYYKGIRQKSQTTFIDNLESDEREPKVAVSKGFGGQAMKHLEVAGEGGKSL